MAIFRYVRNRLLLFIGGIALILVTSFFAIYRLPGDPARMILGPRASAESVAQFQKDAGLNDPVLTQFVRFVGRVGVLDFGESLTYRRPVLALVNERIGQSLRLIGYAFLIMWVFAVILPVCLRASGGTLADDGLRAL